ncbi:very short patch repair endonuclease [Luteipulveratus sp. YIM 133132]|uniref:very short patch repair endonuclease n=1 Tax=Luteipulveratus flavus TaxID=3031728 RepID=UPI0023B0DC16|nr:very short patch repair endonuclease [Luteipulveratus sp. YIM 133132]MDE9364523.1 very short patch repair endonuclease [Luteipulveratus sp. YIM 133132]
MTVESWASSPATRTSMLGNRRSGTKPEAALRSALHRAGLRFRKDYRLALGALKVRPDVVFTRTKVAVFVDGCFWHSCPVHGTKPIRNADYWIPKLSRNVERDREHDAALVDHGWRVIHIWEHEPLEVAVRRVIDAVSAR